MGECITWTGVSGATYEYWFLGTTLTPGPTEVRDEAGNYMFVKYSGTAWLPVYIGHTVSLRERILNHPELPCAHGRLSSRIMAHISTGDEGVRRVEQSDLILSYNPPCNQFGDSPDW